MAARSMSSAASQAVAGLGGGDCGGTAVAACEEEEEEGCGRGGHPHNSTAIRTSARFVGHVGMINWSHGKRVGLMFAGYGYTDGAIGGK